MPVDIKQHYVAFLDILGFSEMVNSDNKYNDQRNLTKLYKCHQSLSQFFKDHADCTITQFSDSVVIAKPYDPNLFQWFVGRVADYQRMLLDEHLLCRGGIAVNMHYSVNSFTFSSGLIAAYKIESKLARYPRVVVSHEVLNLVYPDIKDTPRLLVKEDDGLYFVDYIGATSKRRPKVLEKSIKIVIDSLVENEDSSVKEKGRWLASYADAALHSSHSRQRFEGKSIKL